MGGLAVIEEHDEHVPHSGVGDGALQDEQGRGLRAIHEATRPGVEVHRRDPVYPRLAADDLGPSEEVLRRDRSLDLRVVGPFDEELIEAALTVAVRWDFL